MYYYLLLEITVYYYANAYYSKTSQTLPRSHQNPSQKPSKPSPNVLKRLPQITPKKPEITNWTQVSDTPSGTPSDSSASTPHRPPFLSSRKGG